MTCVAGALAGPAVSGSVPRPHVCQGAVAPDTLGGLRRRPFMRPGNVFLQELSGRRLAMGQRSRSGSRLVAKCEHPGNDSLAPTKDVENLVIIGSGPAGYTAAIYAARANLQPLMFEGYQVGGVRGGQLMTTTEVENFPGFPEGITGPDLMERMQAQAERWGTELLQEDVEFVDLSQRPFVVRGTEREVKAHSIIIATGATAKRLGIPSEERFWSNGISACAICDGASPAFKQKELAVVGGGDTAVEEALYLTKYGKHVHLLVRGPKLRASAAMQDRAKAHPKVTVHLNTGVQDAYADAKGNMGGLMLADSTTGETRKLPVRGLFYGIGHQPNSGIVAGQIDLDEMGYVKVSHGVQTSVDGVFSAGDLHDTEWRQAITAAGSGCMAALSSERFLAANDLLQEFHQPSGKQAERKEERAVEAQEVSSGELDLLATRHKGQYALRKLYHESPRLLAVFYTSPSCGPCRTLKPIFNGVIDEYPGRIHLVEINIEQDPEIAEAAGVSGTPTIQFFKDKELRLKLPGVKQKREYREVIESNI